VAFAAGAFNPSAFVVIIDIAVGVAAGIVFGHPLSVDELLRFAKALELASSTSSIASSSREGFLKRAANAAEAAAAAMTFTAESELGYWKRLAEALEVRSGTSGLEEADSYEGYIKRIVDALEVVKGSSTSGTMEQRLLVGADGITL